MDTQNRIVALPALSSAGLVAAADGDAVAQEQPSVGAAELWKDPQPPPLHLVLTVDPAEGTLNAPGCALVPRVNAFAVTATVRNGANNIVSDIDGNSVLLTIEHDANPLTPAVAARLCGTVSAMITGGVAQFTTVGIDLPGLPDLYTLRGHTAGATDGISPGICIGLCIE